MLRFKHELMSPFLTFLLMLAMTPLLIEGAHVEQKYKRVFSKCKLTDAFTQMTAKSLATCSAMCTKSPVCKSFAWRPGECGLMLTCPRCCNATAGKDGGWNAYCPYGMVYFAC